MPSSDVIQSQLEELMVLLHFFIPHNSNFVSYLSLLVPFFFLPIPLLPHPFPLFLQTNLGFEDSQKETMRKLPDDSKWKMIQSNHKIASFEVFLSFSLFNSQYQKKHFNVPKNSGRDKTKGMTALPPNSL